MQLTHTRRPTGVLFVLLTLLVAGAPLGAQADHDGTTAPQNAEITVATGRWVVGFDQIPAEVYAGASWQGGYVLRVHDVLRHAVVLSDDATFSERVSNSDDVVWAEPDGRVQSLRSPNDPRWDDQYGPAQIGAPGAWDATLGTTERNVCLLDSGLRLDHEDLSGPRWVAGWDFVSDDASPGDGHGHGTHVTGIAVASTDNGRGIAGVSQAGIMHGRVLDNSGNGYASDLAEGIAWCVENDGHVISMSLGTSDNLAVIRNAVEGAWDAGMLLVAAAGNDGPCTDCVLYPAAYGQVIAVGCTNNARNQCSFSSSGPEVELAAPGQSILSTCRGSSASYCSMSGTSMSAPHVAGAAALLWSYAPQLANDAVRSLLTTSAQDRGASGRDDAYGHGIVDVAAALAGAPAPVPSTPIYFEDFEDGVAQNWTTSGYWHVDNKCPLSTDSNQYLGFHHELACVYLGVPSATGSAEFGVDLRNATTAYLRFAHRWETESSTSAARDMMHVQAREGNGNWRTMAWWDSRDPNQLDWSNMTLDLERYVGQQAQLRFRFDAVNLFENHYSGWHLDNVEILADGGVP